MKIAIPFAALRALAACDQAVEGDATTTKDATATDVGGETADNSGILEGEAPGFEAVAPGTYQVTRAGFTPA